ncbi:MAG: hypothetical protein ABEK17_01905, partial [Candidatus Aenigmatarchaeota archaeon]
FSQVFKELRKVIPMLVSVILLLGLFKEYISKEILTKVFIGNLFTDTLLGGIFGSISAGNPITSYIIGGELLDQGVSLFAVTAFIVTWVTVGFVQFPLESKTLGKDFALKRNILSFITAILVSGTTVIILQLLGGLI